MNDSAITNRDLLSVLILAEEGLFFHRLLNQQESYPDSAAVLFLVALPFIATIEHDAILFINRTFGLRLQPESSELTRARHLAKSLDPKHLDYSEYSRQTQAILRQIKSKFKDHQGVLGPLLNRVQADVGICYYRGTPIYGTYTVAHLVNLVFPQMGTVLDDGGVYAREMGYSAGTAGATLYHFSAEFFSDESLFEAPEFLVTANDFSFDDLAKPLANIGVENAAAFFLLSELMMQVASVKALHEGGFFSDVLWLKFATISLYHASRAIDIFMSCIRSGSEPCLYSEEFLEGLSSVFGRRDRKLLKKAKPLRNALVHYDFKSDLIPDSAAFTAPLEALDQAVRSSLSMDISEYFGYLNTATDKFVSNASSLIHFPVYRSWRNVFN